MRKLKDNIWDIAQSITNIPTTFGFLFRAIAYKIFLKKFPFSLNPNKSVRIYRDIKITYPWRMKIGKFTSIGPGNLFLSAGKIKIGKYVGIGPRCMFLSHQHTFKDITTIFRIQPDEYKPITIEDDVYIGAGTIILPGVTIGKGSVIGAGAVVNKSIPPLSIAVGVPAKVIKSRKIINKKHNRY